MCGIYKQNFVWDLKISWEPGSQVPRDSPTLSYGSTATTEKEFGHSSAEGIYLVFALKYFYREKNIS